GPGIPAQDLDRVFEPLYSTKSFGVGLGLPLVRRITEQHDGDIEVESEPGRGTRFVIRLPLKEPMESVA
ncbi:MAG: ATP-binding protein, partial [Rhodospirillales bacterium]|nr:ATP-binding protein [Rhodospirillales bacterium]